MDEDSIYEVGFNDAVNGLQPLQIDAIYVRGYRDGAERRRAVIAARLRKSRTDTNVGCGSCLFLLFGGIPTLVGLAFAFAYPLVSIPLIIVGVGILIAFLMNRKK